MWSSLYFVLLCIYSTFGQQQETQQPGGETKDSGERDPLLVPESGVGQGVNGAWGTSRWRREVFPQLQREDLNECIREIKDSMNCMCGLRDTSVDVPSMANGKTYTLSKCVTVKLCGGPCWVKDMKCTPTEREDVLVPVINRDCKKVYATVETHKACKCTCTLTENSCKDDQVFDRKTCQCQCAKRRPCAVGTFFNVKTCRCECFETLECPAGVEFNSETCKCESETIV